MFSASSNSALSLQLRDIILTDGNELLITRYTLNLNTYLSLLLAHITNRNMLIYIPKFPFETDGSQTMCRGALQSSDFAHFIHGLQFCYSNGTHLVTARCIVTLCIREINISCIQRTVEQEEESSKLHGLQRMKIVINITVNWTIYQIDIP